MVAVRTAPGLVASLFDLAQTLEALDLSSASVVRPGAGRARDHLITTIRHHLIPRLESPGAPLRVVVAGPTGSGKSTLVNSLVGSDVADTGPIRPTTRAPMVLASADGPARYESLAGVDCVVKLGGSGVLEQMTLVDTPDLDSTELENRERAEALIAAADVVVLVTSALRYADEVPWSVIRPVQSRGTPVIHVLNRVTPDAAGCLQDLRARVSAAGLESDVFRIPEYHLTPGRSSLPPASTRRLRERLDEIALGREVPDVHRVVGWTATSALALASAVDDVSSWVAGMQAELNQEFAEAAAGVSFEKPEALGHRDFSSIRSQRHWWRRRSDEGAAARRVAETGRWVAATLEDDLSSLSLRPGDLVVQLPLGAPLGHQVLREGIESAVGSWIDFVARMASPTGEAAPSVATAVLLDAALGWEDAPESAESPSGEPLTSMIERARRELSNRVMTLYEAAAKRTAEQLSPLAVDARLGMTLRGDAEKVARFLDADA